jgi:pantetheine-phosphate adenylyltransferase
MTAYGIYKKFSSNVSDNFQLVPEVIEHVVRQYDRPHRHFHTMNHVISIWEQIDWRFKHTSRIKSQLYVAALFHDAIYDPRTPDNEARSVRLMRYVYGNRPIPGKDLDAIAEIILNSSRHGVAMDLPESSQLFNSFDASCLATGDCLETTEMSIFKEFQYAKLQDYRLGRLAFLENMNIAVPGSVHQSHIDFVHNFRPKIGIFPGTFDPFHTGHLNVLEKAEKIFDKVIIACCRNPNKPKNDEILKNVANVLPYHEVIDWAWMLPDLVREVTRQRADVTVVKGFRHDHDIPYEMDLLWHMRKQMSEINVVYIPCDHDLQYVSGSAVRGYLHFGKENPFKVSKYDYIHNADFPTGM